MWFTGHRKFPRIISMSHRIRQHPKGHSDPFCLRFYLTIKIIWGQLRYRIHKISQEIRSDFKAHSASLDYCSTTNKFRKIYSCENFSNYKMQCLKHVISSAELNVKKITNFSSSSLIVFGSGNIDRESIIIILMNDILGNLCQTIENVTQLYRNRATSTTVSNFP